MLVGIHKGKWGRFPKSLQVYEKILEYNKIDHIRLDINESDFWDKVKKLDLFVFHFDNITDLKEIANVIIPIIQDQLKIRCFPDISTVWSYDDKIKEYYILSQAGFPVINNFIFWNKGPALEWAEKATYPVVFKLKSGSQSDNVILVKNRKFAEKIIKRMFGKGVDPNKVMFNVSKRIKDFSFKGFLHGLAIKFYRFYNGLDQYPLWDKQKNYVIFQEFLKGNTFDTRIAIIGDKAFGFIRHNRKNDFRASGSEKKDYDPEKIDLRCVKIAFDVSDFFKFQTMAFDFLYNEKGDPVICEISYDYPTKSIFLAPGYWDRNLNWHEGHYWPQYLYLKDILELPDLRQPEIEQWEEDTLMTHIGKRLFGKKEKSENQS